MCCVYDGLEPYNHYEPQQDTNPIPTEKLVAPRIGAAQICVDVAQWACSTRSRVAQAV
jgi:hypothetical protein